MEELLQDIRYGARALLRRPGFAVAALLTLALGTGATVAIYSVVQGVLLRPLPFVEPERIVVFGRVAPDAAGSTPVMSHLDFLDYREATRSLESMALYQSASVTVTGMGDATAIQGAQVTADFFRVLGAGMLHGRSFDADEQRIGGPRAIIISHAFWQERFGGAADVIGETMYISGIPRPIVGVTPPGFEFPAGALVYTPIRPNDESCGRACAPYLAIGRLAPGVDRAGAQAELGGVARQLEAEHPGTNRGIGAALLPLAEHLTGGVRRSLGILFAAVLMVLLIACANVANLVLVRGSGRGTELAMRRMLGASRGRVVRQLVTENALLAAVGAGAGMLLATWAVAGVRALAPPELPRVEAIAVDAGVVAFAAALAVLTTLFFGLLPALRITRDATTAALRGGRGPVGPRSDRGRSAILVAEIALAVMLLSGAGLLLRTLASMNEVDLGFESPGLAYFTVGLPPMYATLEERETFFAELTRRMNALPEVESAGLVTPVPIAGAGSTVVFQRADAPAEAGHEPSARARVAEAGGLRALGAPLVAGRLFADSDRADAPPVVLVNRSAARRFWPDTDPVGRQIRFGSGGSFEEQPRTVVGIIGDVRGASITQEPEPELIVPYAQTRSPFGTMLVRSRQPDATLIAARAEVGGIDPNLPLVSPTVMTDAVAAQTAGTRFYLLLIGGFAGLAVVLAAIGIYGVLASIVAQRRREIGVRMAVGARIADVVRLVLRQGLAPALAGLALGLAGAAATGRAIAGMLYGVSPGDPLTWMAVSFILLGVAAIACVVPARRAAAIAPASALRGE